LEVYILYIIDNNGNIVERNGRPVSKDHINAIYMSISEAFTIILEIPVKNILSCRVESQRNLRTYVAGVCKTIGIDTITDDEPFELRFIPTIRGILSAIRNKYELDISRP
jgi:hypothetical protein